MNSVVSLDHSVLSFLFCRQVTISALHSDTPGNPTRLAVVSICVRRTKKLQGQWLRILGEISTSLIQNSASSAMLTKMKSKKNFTKIN